MYSKSTVTDTEVKRVAAYCRVSTDNLDQANSLESQEKYFYEYINRNPLWELYDIYVDEGISGTSTKKRAAFNRMIDDAKSKKFDLIITKEISRFARNIVDSISYTRELKRLGIGVIFMTDGINSLDGDAELRMGIMSSIAQEESRKTSERVKWGHRRRMEQGVVFGRDMLGYDVRDGKLIVNEEGAKTVRLIYHKYLDEGKGTHTIAKELREAGIKTSTYMKEWSYTVILRVLKNEKYCGDLVQQKTFTPDYLTHQKKYNRGQLEYVTIKNHHEPIISREMFEAVQREIARRSNKKASKDFAKRYAMSGKIVCGECGAAFTRRRKILKSGIENVRWVCHENSKNGNIRHETDGGTVGCGNGSVNDKDLKEILKYIVGEALADKNKITEKIMTIINAVLQSDSGKNEVKNIENQLEKLESKRQRLLDMCISGDIDTSEYRLTNERLKAEQQALNEKLEKEKSHVGAVANKEKIMADIKNHINGLICGSEWDEVFYRNIVSKIVVYKGRSLDIHLNFIPEAQKARILCGQAEIDAFNEKNHTCVSSVPMSVRVLRSSGSGIVKRWLR